MTTALIIVCYDVSTETAEGRRRLRKVAKACERVGQRVQRSVFECRLNEMQTEELERSLVEMIDSECDCLRLYRLPEPADLRVREYGKHHALDFDGPLIV